MNIKSLVLCLWLTFDILGISCNADGTKDLYSVAMPQGLADLSLGMTLKQVTSLRKNANPESRPQGDAKLENAVFTENLKNSITYSYAHYVFIISRLQTVMVSHS